MRVFEVNEMKNVFKKLGATLMCAGIVTAMVFALSACDKDKEQTKDLSVSETATEFVEVFNNMSTSREYTLDITKNIDDTVTRSELKLRTKGIDSELYGVITQGESRAEIFVGWPRIFEDTDLYPDPYVLQKEDSAAWDGRKITSRDIPNILKQNTDNSLVIAELKDYKEAIEQDINISVYNLKGKVTTLKDQFKSMVITMKGQNSGVDFDISLTIVEVNGQKNIQTANIKKTQNGSTRIIDATYSYSVSFETPEF